jgi:hypothetical protein
MTESRTPLPTAYKDHARLSPAPTVSIIQAGDLSCPQAFFRNASLENGYDIRTAQELPGHNDVLTTMIYTHVLDRGGQGVHSPAYSL